ncbi:hypothetical protein [Photorhabdus bodei]|uniref:Uncharacterized protein n=1 Tax=Photorhabdus bodei TaxID=2029681 RepID=A0A329WRH8_9GAMM|nr:hypothetical protein [Photorhabdus bodei]MDB6374948.1 hypothetical protein [Photorhabdus bodei]RAX06545.1 hypothetical protein CKY02_22545 [Photorhabdus bodei]
MFSGSEIGKIADLCTKILEKLGIIVCENIDAKEFIKVKTKTLFGPIQGTTTNYKILKPP